ARRSAPARTESRRPFTTGTAPVSTAAVTATPRRGLALVTPRKPLRSWARAATQARRPPRGRRRPPARGTSRARRRSPSSARAGGPPNGSTGRTGKPTELIFAKRAVVHFAVDPDEVYLTTRLEGRATRFLPFNQGSD